ncbi:MULTISPECIES: AAA family ATPase [Hyphomonas]|uniref:ATPase n=1 Tax=Hyphomonas adhaerens TaxID=81029 RepID=A0A3B9GWU4_9PROT|nr:MULTISPECIES: AAA family ATPase [Hyphomonas]MBB39014.1 ATPase [Hyphomonas sp.]HAE26464.1 ATPase [Hyphomonas adhaerens]|tara:strand:- start:141 stop:701 length:561 start_codon:yes stop_codon:yes gene_type:complete
MDNFILISGCSGGGKSTLLKALKARGHHVVEEPGRRIVEAEQASGGDALPWTDIEAFLHRALDLAVADHRASRHLSGPVFFDRGVMDAAVALRHVTGHPEAETLADDYRYNRAVFLAPPWPDIFTSDEARRHGMDEAVAEYARLEAALPALGYDTHVLPKAPVETRADYVLSVLADAGPRPGEPAS